MLLHDTNISRCKNVITVCNITVVDMTTYISRMFQVIKITKVKSKNIR